MRKWTIEIAGINVKTTLERKSEVVPSRETKDTKHKQNAYT
jgi:hypothetical protein